MNYCSLLNLGKAGIFAILLPISSCLSPLPPSESPQEALQAIFDREWEFSLKESPLRATSVGVHTYNDQLPSVTEADFQRRADFRKGLLEELAAIDTSQFSRTDLINYQLFRFLQENAISQIENQTYLMPINSEGGFYSSFPFMVDRMPYHTYEDYNNYLSRLAAFPSYTDQYIQLMERGIELGYVPPRIILQGYEGGIALHRDAKLEESVFYRPFKQFPASVTESQQASLREQAEGIIRDSVQATYRRLGEFMSETYVPSARESLGASELPNGRDWYEQRVRFFTTLPYSSDEIFEIGQLEVRRIRREMDSVMRSTGFKGDFADFLQFLRTDPQFYAQTPRELLMQASYFSKRIDGRLPKFFSPIPRSPTE